MRLFKRLAAVLLDPSENADRFVALCNSTFRRALQLPPLYCDPVSFPPDAVALCVCAHLCKMSIPHVHDAFSRSVGQGEEKQPSAQQLSQDCVSRVYEHGWKHVLKPLHLDTTDKTRDSNVARGIFDGYTFFFVPSLLFSERAAELLLARVQEKGGKGKVYQKGENGFKVIGEELKEEHDRPANSFACADSSLITKYAQNYNVPTVPPKWIRDCLRDVRIKDMTLYSTFPQKNVGKVSDVNTPPTRKRQRDFKAECAADRIETIAKRSRRRGESNAHERSGKEVSDLVSPVRIRDYEGISKVRDKSNASTEETRFSNWACERRTALSRGYFPMNEKICELLGIVQESYAAKKDGFRAVGYQKAIARISALDTELTTIDDVRVLSAGRSIGERMEKKVMEIVRTGRLLQAEAVLQNCDNKAVRELCNVWGIGPVKALNLIAHEIRTIEDLRAAVKKNPALLDKNQKIGLRHYEDLLLRIPRDRVAELERFVRMVVKSIDESLDITVAGSYLRGKKDCGDVDILVYGSRERLRRGFSKVKEAMKRKGVLTDDLVEGDGKYFGVFRFPGRPHARIDLFSVPDEEYPFALLTYTGSAIFNRSMRAKARALGYSLSHKGLQRVNRNRSSKTRVEPPIRVRDEKEIFLLLDIPYVAPAARSI